MAEEAGHVPARPARVLLALDADACDRLGAIVQHLCVGMIDEPVRIRILLRTRRETCPEAFGPVQVLRNRPRYWPLDRDWPEDVLEALDENPPDIIHALSTCSGAWAQKLRETWQRPLVVHVTDLDDLHGLGRLLAEPEITPVTVTQQLQQLAARHWPARRDRFRMIPFGVPAEEEPACLVDPQRVPSAMITTPLTAACGLDVVLRALHTLVHSGHEVQLFVLSTGRAEATFRRQVEHLDLRRWVTFAGSVEDPDTVSAAMRGADFFLEPNPGRRFTAHMLTAMADGLAILAPHGTLQDYLMDGTTARLFDATHSADLAEKWGELLHDRAAALRLAHSALDYVRAHHQASSMVSATAQLYRELHSQAR